MKPKYYPYWIREDYLNGMFSTTVENESESINKVVKLFNNEDKTLTAMSLVVKKWPKATEHSLTNRSINKIAWLGQAACCLKVRVPDYITKKAWWILPKEVRDRADRNASEVIKKYENRIKSKCIGGGKA